MTHATVTRRALLARSAAAGLGLAALGGTVGCGKDEDRLVLSSWPEYIDFAGGERSPTLTDFEREHGIAVEYLPEINDYAEYFAKLRPQLALGDSGGRDLLTTIDWLAARLKRLGWVEPIDALELPNVRANLVDELREPDFDPGRRYSIPWQAGQTGLLYRHDRVGGAIEAAEELFHPRVRGRVVLQRDMRDTLGLVMLAMGRDPQHDGLDAALAAVERVERAVRDRQVLRFAGLDYRSDLLQGDAWLAIGWSGDAYRLGRDEPRLRFAHPAEGFLLWTDNLQIPVGAPHRAAARRLIDFYYRPEVHALLTRELHYMPPVKGVREVLERTDPELIESELVFPSERTLSRARMFRTLAPDEERELTAAFERAIGA